MWETRLGRGGLESLEGRSLPSSEAEIKRAAGGLGSSRSRVSRYPRARRKSLRGFEEASVAPYRACALEFSWMVHKWTKFQQSPTNSKVRNEEQKDHCDVSSLIYQSFGMSPVRVELIPRITRFIFPQLKNGLGLEFSVICGQTSPEITTDTRLPKQPRLTRASMVCSHIF